MTLTGAHIDAEHALRIGLVTRVVPLSDLMKSARGIAETICRKAPLGVRFSKEAIRRGNEMNLSDGLAFENALFTASEGNSGRQGGNDGLRRKTKTGLQGRLENLWMDKS